MHAYRHDGEPKKIHAILKLVEDVGNISSLPEFKKYERLFAKLVTFYISSRYNIYKNQVANSLNFKTSESILNETKEAFEWLKSLQK